MVFLCALYVCAFSKKQCSLLCSHISHIQSPWRKFWNIISFLLIFNKLFLPIGISAYGGGRFLLDSFSSGLAIFLIIEVVDLKAEYTGKTQSSNLNGDLLISCLEKSKHCESRVDSIMLAAEGSDIFKLF